MSDFDGEMYHRYCKAWWTYLHKINEPGEGSFRQRMWDLIPADRIERIRRHRIFAVWPEIWPELEYCYGDRDTFTLAVEAATK